MRVHRLYLLFLSSLVGSVLLAGCPTDEESGLASERPGVPQLTGGDGCFLVLEEFVGRPSNMSPNGSQSTVSEECEDEDTNGDGTTSTTYEVAGSTEEEACNDIFGSSGPSDPATGVRYGGRTDFAIEFGWSATPVPTEVTISEITWSTSMLLPSWEAPKGAETGNWKHFSSEVTLHEQGHVDIYDTGMEAVVEEMEGEVVTVPEGATEEQKREAVMDAITESTAFQDMMQAQADYDAPFDETSNPTGTNHGTENGQDANWGDLGAPPE